MYARVSFLALCLLLFRCAGGTSVSVGDQAALRTAVLDPDVSFITLTDNIVLNPTVWLPTSEVVRRSVTIDGGAGWPVLDFNYVKDALLVAPTGGLAFSNLITRGDTSSTPDIVLDWLSDSPGAPPITFNSVVRAMVACPPLPTLIPLLEAMPRLPDMPGDQTAASVRTLTCFGTNNGPDQAPGCFTQALEVDLATPTGPLVSVVTPHALGLVWTNGSYFGCDLIEAPDCVATLGVTGCGQSTTATFRLTLAARQQAVADDYPPIVPNAPPRSPTATNRPPQPDPLLRPGALKPPRPQESHLPPQSEPTPVLQPPGQLLLPEPPSSLLPPHPAGQLLPPHPAGQPLPPRPAGQPLPLQPTDLLIPSPPRPGDLLPSPQMPGGLLASPQMPGVLSSPQMPAGLLLSPHVPGGLLRVPLSPQPALVSPPSSMAANSSQRAPVPASALASASASSRSRRLAIAVAVPVTLLAGGFALTAFITFVLRRRRVRAAAALQETKLAQYATGPPPWASKADTATHSRKSASRSMVLSITLRTGFQSVQVNTVSSLGMGLSAAMGGSPHAAAFSAGSFATIRNSEGAAALEADSFAIYMDAVDDESTLTSSTMLPTTNSRLTADKTYGAP